MGRWAQGSAFCPSLSIHMHATQIVSVSALVHRPSKANYSLHVEYAGFGELRDQT